MPKTIYLAASPTYRGTDSYELMFYYLSHAFPNNPIIEEPGHYDLLILVADEDGSIDHDTYDQVTDAYLAGKLVQLAIVNRKKKLSLVQWNELDFEPFDGFVRVGRKLVASPA